MQVNSMLCERAHTNIVLADATMIGRVALAQVRPMSGVDYLITDTRAPKDALDQIRRQGCQVITA